MAQEIKDKTNEVTTAVERYEATNDVEDIARAYRLSTELRSLLGTELKDRKKRVA